MPVPDTIFEIEAWLSDWLGQVPEVLELMGQGKVFPIIIPTTQVLPAIVYRRMGTERAKHATGATGNAKARFEITLLAKASAEAYRVICRCARGIRLKLDGLTSKTAGQEVQPAFLEDEMDGAVIDPPSPDEDFVMTRVLTISVAYVEQDRDLRGGA